MESGKPRQKGHMSKISLSDCLDEINNALNFWYPLRSDTSETERNARHVRLFGFRNKLHRQLKAANPSDRKDAHDDPACRQYSDGKVKARDGAGVEEGCG